MVIFTIIGVLAVVSLLLYFGVKMETGEGILVPEAQKEQYRKDKIKQDLRHLKDEKADLLVKEYGKFLLGIFNKRNKISEEDLTKVVESAYILNAEPIKELIHNLVYDANLLQKDGEYFILGEAMKKVHNRFPNFYLFLRKLSISKNNIKSHVSNSKITFNGINIADLFDWKLKDKIHLSSVNFGIAKKDSFDYPTNETEIRLKDNMKYEYNIYMYIIIIYHNTENNPTIRYFSPAISIVNDVGIEEYEKYYNKIIKMMKEEIPSNHFEKT